jgi:hypothetical protein
MEKNLVVRASEPEMMFRGCKIKTETIKKEFKIYWIFNLQN